MEYDDNWDKSDARNYNYSTSDHCNKKELEVHEEEVFTCQKEKRFLDPSHNSDNILTSGEQQKNKEYSDFTPRSENNLSQEKEDSSTSDKPQFSIRVKTLSQIEEYLSKTNHQKEGNDNWKEDILFQRGEPDLQESSRDNLAEEINLQIQESHFQSGKENRTKEGESYGTWDDISMEKDRSGEGRRDNNKKEMCPYNEKEGDFTKKGGFVQRGTYICEKQDSDCNTKEICSSLQEKVYEREERGHQGREDCYSKKNYKLKMRFSMNNSDEEMRNEYDLEMLDDLPKKENCLEKKELYLRKKEDYLRKREDYIKKREYDLIKREDDLLKKEENLKIKENILQRKENYLLWREDNLKKLKKDHKEDLTKKNGHFVEKMDQDFQKAGADDSIKEYYLQQVEDNCENTEESFNLRKRALPVKESDLKKQENDCNLQNKNTILRRQEIHEEDLQNEEVLVKKENEEEEDYTEKMDDDVRKTDDILIKKEKEDDAPESEGELPKDEEEEEGSPVKDVLSPAPRPFQGLIWNSDLENTSRRSAFQPYRRRGHLPQEQIRKSSETPREPYSPPVEESAFVLTNYQRGNIQTLTPQLDGSEFHWFESAGRGDLIETDVHRVHDIDATDGDGLTALMWSAAYGQASTVQLLLEKGADTDITGKHLETAMHLAAAGGHQIVIRHLVAYGADPDVFDEEGNTPLLYAIHGDHPRAVIELLRHGVSMFKPDCYSYAVMKDRSQVKAILERHLMNLLGRN